MTLHPIQCLSYPMQPNRDQKVDARGRPVEYTPGGKEEDELASVLSHIVKLLENRGIVYVHCDSGLGRSAVVVTCMLAHLYGLSATDALTRVQLYTELREYTTPMLTWQRLQVYKLLSEWPLAPKHPPLFVEGTLELEAPGQAMVYKNGVLMPADFVEKEYGSDEEGLQEAIRDDLILDEDDAQEMTSLNEEAQKEAMNMMMSMNMDLFMENLDIGTDELGPAKSVYFDSPENSPKGRAPTKKYNMDLRGLGMGVGDKNDQNQQMLSPPMPQVSGVLPTVTEGTEDEYDDFGDDEDENYVAAP